MYSELYGQIDDYIVTNEPFIEWYFINLFSFISDLESALTEFDNNCLKSSVQLTV